MGSIPNLLKLEKPGFEISACIPFLSMYAMNFVGHSCVFIPRFFLKRTHFFIPGLYNIFSLNFLLWFFNKYIMVHNFLHVLISLVAFFTCSSGSISTMNYRISIRKHRLQWWIRISILSILKYEKLIIVQKALITTKQEHALINQW